MIDSLCLECGERFPTSATTIHHRGHSASESKTIGWQRFESITQIVVLLCSKEIVGMNIDKTWRYIESFCINYLSLFGINVFSHQSNLVILDGDIHHLVDLIFGIDHMSAFDNDRVILRVRLNCDETESQEKNKYFLTHEK